MWKKVLRFVQTKMMPPWNSNWDTPSGIMGSCSSWNQPGKQIILSDLPWFWVEYSCIPDTAIRISWLLWGLTHVVNLLLVAGLTVAYEKYVITQSLLRPLLYLSLTYILFRLCARIWLSLINLLISPPYVLFCLIKLSNGSSYMLPFGNIFFHLFQDCLNWLFSSSEVLLV